jgi:protein gp37
VGKDSGIEWTEDTWNPVRGCTRVSPGCVNCYAERMAARNLPGMAHLGEPFAIMQPSGPHWTGRVELIPHMLDVPLKRKKPTTYFVNSMSDLFHERLSDEDIDRVFAVMALCPQHTFQVLTKRAKRLREWCQRLQKMADEWAPHTKRGFFTPSDVLNFRHMHATFGRGPAFPNHPWPLPNVWIGVSVEDQRRADERIPELLATPAAVRFLSAEPLLGPVDLRQAHFTDGPEIDWVIVGGESGPGARPMQAEWALALRDQCVAAGVPFFFKQFGEWLPDSQNPASTEEVRRAAGPTQAIRVGKKRAGRLLDGREWSEMPRAHEGAL